MLTGQQAGIDYKFLFRGSFRAHDLCRIHRQIYTKKMHNGIPPMLAFTQRILIIILLSVLTACDALIDCLDADGPVFDKRTLTVAVLNQEYQESIRARINNEPLDDWFTYRFQLRGQLPKGLSTFQNGRTFLFEGTATELGDFTFELFVDVSSRGDRVTYSTGTSGLCYTSRSQRYELTVDPL